jgi:hypothetical protein
LSPEKNRSRGQIKRLESLECEELARALGDTPETVIAVHVLRRGLCSAYSVNERNNSDAVVILSTRLPEEPTGFGSDAEGIAAGAVVDGGLASLACTTAPTDGHADLGVVTVGPWRGQGLATACAALTAQRVRRAGRLPVWGTGEDNVASLRVARRLGFEKASCRTYVIPVVKLPHDVDLPPR